MDNEQKIEELEENIKEWQKEYDEIWREKNTPAAEVERRNLQNLINNAKRKINELKGIQENNMEKFDLAEFKEKMAILKSTKMPNEEKVNRLLLQKERLIEEQKDYAKPKNGVYQNWQKEIYQEYQHKIEEIDKEIENYEKESQKLKDEATKYIEANKDTILRTIYIELKENDTKISELDEKLAAKQKEVLTAMQNAEMEEVTSKTGEKMKRPRVLSIYAEIDELKKQKEEIVNENQLLQNYREELKGKEKAADLTTEDIKFFHGQGDHPERTTAKKEQDRENRLENDQYFFEESQGRYVAPQGKAPKEDPTKDPEKDPAKDPVKDPAKDPAKDPSKDPAKDPEKDPTKDPVKDPGKDPGKDPEPNPDPEPKLPLNSGLQVYRKVLNEAEEMGVKFNKRSAHSTNPWVTASPIAITAATTALGTVVLPGIGTYIGLGTGALVSSTLAPIISRITGRKKATDKIYTALDDLSKEDLELLLDDFLLENGNDKNITKIKAHELFLDALIKKCEKELPGQLEMYESEMQEKRAEIFKLKQALTNAQDITQKSMYEKMIEDSQKELVELERKGEKWSEYARTVEDGKDNNSLKRHKNLGGIFSKRNINNVQEVNELADIELKKLEAEEKAKMASNEQEERKSKIVAADAREEMKDYMNSQTKHVKILGREYSVGKFEAPKGKIKVLSNKEYALPKITYAGLSAGITALSMANRIMSVTRANNSKISQFMSQKQTELENIKNGVNPETVSNSMKAEGLLDHEVTERTHEFVGGFDENSKAYIESEQKGMPDVVSRLKGTNKQTQNIMEDQSDTLLGKIAKLLKVKGENLRNINGEGLSKASSDWYKGYGFSTPGDVGHTVTAGLENSADSILKAQADTMEQMAQLTENIDSFNLSETPEIKADYLPILIANAPLVGKIIEAIKNRTKTKASRVKRATKKDPVIDDENDIPFPDDLEQDEEDIELSDDLEQDEENIEFSDDFEQDDGDLEPDEER